MRIKKAFISGAIAALLVASGWLYGFSVATKAIPECIDHAYSEINAEIKANPLPRINSVQLARDHLNGKVSAPFLVKVSTSIPESPQSALHGALVYRSYWAFPWGIKLRAKSTIEVW